MNKGAAVLRGWREALRGGWGSGADGGGRLEFGEDFRGQGLLGAFVLGFGVADSVDRDEQEVSALEDVEGGAGAGAGDVEGVAGEAGDGDETAGGLHGVAEGFVFDAGLFEREVEAGFALAVEPGAVGGAVAGGAGFAVEDGCVRCAGEDRLDLEGSEQGAGDDGPLGVGGDEGGEEEGRGGEGDETRRAKGHGRGALRD